MAPALSPRLCQALERISRAARRVKVMERIEEGSAFSSRTRKHSLCTAVKVFPEPGPATTMAGP